MKVFRVSKRLAALFIAILLASALAFSAHAVAEGHGKPPRPVPSAEHGPAKIVKPGIRLMATGSPTTRPSPAVTRTVKRTVRVTGPTRRVTVVPPRQTTTRYVTIRPPAETVIRRQTVTQTTTKTATKTAVVTHSVTLPPRENTVVLTRTEAVGISALFVLAGIAVTVLLVWAAYALGWVRGDGGNRRFLKEVTEDLKYDK